MQSKSSDRGLILFGGGIDSACLGHYLHDAGTSFDLLCIDYGQKAWRGEYFASKHFASLYGCNIHTVRINAYETLSHPMLKNGQMASEHNMNVLPLRNQTLLDEAVRFAMLHKYADIYVGFHVEPCDSKFYDAMPTFLRAYQSLLDCQHIQIEVKAPFQEMVKTEYLTYLPRHEWRNTFSCYESESIYECGKCTHCQQKKELFQREGVSIDERRD